MSIGSGSATDDSVLNVWNSDVPDAADSSLGESESLMLTSTLRPYEEECSRKRFCISWKHIS